MDLPDNVIAGVMMKKIFGVVALAILFPIQSYAAIMVSEVNPNGSGTTDADWFELTNTGNSAIDITGWRMDDSGILDPPAATFGPEVTSILAGQSVVFLETGANFSTRVETFNTRWFGTTTSSVVFGSYNGSGVGLSSNGDAVNIFNSAGVLQANVSFGANTIGSVGPPVILGRTFDNAAGLNNTVITQLSAIGVNGAFQSFFGIDVGSPGTISAVPEPASIVLMSMVAFAGAFGTRFRKRVA